LTLTYDPVCQSWAAKIMTRTRTKFQFISQSVQKIEWKQTDGQTDVDNRY